VKRIPPKGVQFSSTNQPKKNGRKPNKFKKFIKENEISSDDISNVISTMLQKNEEELKTIMNDKKVPFLLRGFVRALFDDVQKGNLNNIQVLLDRSVGKVKEKVEHSGNINLIFDEDDKNLL